MNSYRETLAPIFTQIILQKEFEQHQILRETYEKFKANPYALEDLHQDYAKFDRAAQEFKKLWSAHKRIKDKSYGKCNECGGSIDLLRLNVEPATLHCLSCNDKRDRYALRAIRKCA